MLIIKTLLFVAHCATAAAASVQLQSFFDNNHIRGTIDIEFFFSSSSSAASHNALATNTIIFIANLTILPAGLSAKQRRLLSNGNITDNIIDWSVNEFPLEITKFTPNDWRECGKYVGEPLLESEHNVTSFSITTDNKNATVIQSTLVVSVPNTFQLADLAGRAMALSWAASTGSSYSQPKTNKACANIDLLSESSSSIINARARIGGGVAGDIYFRQYNTDSNNNDDQKRQFTNIFADLYSTTTIDDENALYAWKLLATDVVLDSSSPEKNTERQNSNNICQSARITYDPRVGLGQQPKNEAQCSLDAPEKCVVGEMTLKFGPLQAAGGGGTGRRRQQQVFIDYSLDLYDLQQQQQSTRRVFVVLYHPSNPITPHACGEIYFLQPKTVQAYFNHQRLLGTIEFQQASPFALTRVRVNLKLQHETIVVVDKSNMRFVVTELPLLLSAHQSGGGDKCARINVGNIFNPFYDNNSDNNNPNDGFVSSASLQQRVVSNNVQQQQQDAAFVVGRLYNKHANFYVNNSTSEDNKNVSQLLLSFGFADANIPLWGAYSIVGRSLTLQQQQRHVASVDLVTTTTTTEEPTTTTTAAAPTTRRKRSKVSSVTTAAPTKSTQQQQPKTGGDDDLWQNIACTNIRPAKMHQTILARAEFNYFVAGIVYFEQIAGDADGDTTVYGDLLYSAGQLNATTNHRLIVHTNRVGSDSLKWIYSERCHSAGGVYDPFGVVDVSQHERQQNRNNPPSGDGESGEANPLATCVFGTKNCPSGEQMVRHMRPFGIRAHAYYAANDNEKLIGRFFGTIPGGFSLQQQQQPSAITGRSLVLWHTKQVYGQFDADPHAQTNMIACANIDAVVPLQATTLSSSTAGALRAKITLHQPTPYDYTTLSVSSSSGRLADLSRVQQVAIHEFPVESNVEIQCLESSIGQIYDPFKLATTHRTAETVEKLLNDQWPIGALSAKHAQLLQPNTTTIIDTNLPLWGPHSVVGRALVFTIVGMPTTTTTRNSTTTGIRNLPLLPTAAITGGGSKKFRNFIAFDPSNAETLKSKNDKRIQKNSSSSFFEQDNMFWTADGSDKHKQRVCASLWLDAAKTSFSNDANDEFKPVKQNNNIASVRDIVTKRAIAVFDAHVGGYIRFRQLVDNTTGMAVSDLIIESRLYPLQRKSLYTNEWNVNYTTQFAGNSSWRYNWAIHQLAAGVDAGTWYEPVRCASTGPIDNPYNYNAVINYACTAHTPRRCLYGDVGGRERPYANNETTKTGGGLIVALGTRQMHYDEILRLDSVVGKSVVIYNITKSDTHTPLPRMACANILEEQEATLSLRILAIPSTFSATEFERTVARALNVTKWNVHVDRGSSIGAGGATANCMILNVVIEAPQAFVLRNALNTMIHSRHRLVRNYLACNDPKLTVKEGIRFKSSFWGSGESDGAFRRIKTDVVLHIMSAVLSVASSVMFYFNFL